VWRDLGISGNARLTPEIMQAVETSATMLVVLSNGYMASEWCKRERSKFLDTVGPLSTRLFVVEMAPVPREVRPEEFRDLIGYPFWKRDREELPARTLGFPIVGGDDHEYWTRINRLAVQLADELKRTRGPIVSR
jgi:hypothetical protein